MTLSIHFIEERAVSSGGLANTPMPARHVDIRERPGWRPMADIRQGWQFLQQMAFSHDMARHAAAQAAADTAH